MEYYQARISIETARLMEQVKRLYEIEKGVTITRAEVLMNSYRDSLWVKDWEKDVRNKRKDINIEKIDITPSSQKLKVHISEEVEKGIKNLKEKIPKDISTRSVTYGVVIEYILLAAYLKISQEIEIKKTSVITRKFDIFKQELSKILNNGELDLVMNLSEKLELDLKEELERINLSDYQKKS
jgi:tetrahydromethanopterin S-methyltransferase subunit G